MYKYRRINFFGGPGSGKSTTAANIFAELKKQHFDVELVTEYVKLWAYEGRYPDKYDQITLFAQQLNHEKTVLKNSQATIITDSPVPQNIVYTDLHSDDHISYGLRDLYLGYRKEYPELNIFINRGNKKYKKLGRFGGVEAAKKIDEQTKSFLKQSGIYFWEFDFQQATDILEFIKGVL